MDKIEATRLAQQLAVFGSTVLEQAEKLQEGNFPDLAVQATQYGISCLQEAGAISRAVVQQQQQQGQQGQQQQHQPWSNNPEYRADQLTRGEVSGRIIQPGQANVR